MFQILFFICLQSNVNLVQFPHSLTIDKVEESFQINLDMTFCLDGDCTPIPILSDAIIPIPFCNPNATFELPGDGSFAALAKDLGGNVGELAIQAGLRKLGIQVGELNQWTVLTQYFPKLCQKRITGILLWWD